MIGIDIGDDGDDRIEQQERTIRLVRLRDEVFAGTQARMRPGGEQLATDELLRESYRGIRPAPGYPACPEHSVKAPLFEALNCAEVGITLTENYAMLPASSVSGFYLAHPQAKYFNVGRIGRDQLDDLAQRCSDHHTSSRQPGRRRAERMRAVNTPLVPTKWARRWLEARSESIPFRQSRSAVSIPRSAATRAAPTGPSTQ